MRNYKGIASSIFHRCSTDKEATARKEKNRRAIVIFLTQASSEIVNDPPVRRFTRSLDSCVVAGGIPNQPLSKISIFGRGGNNSH